MHSRVLNYLNKKNPTNYTQLDKILSFYANKKLEEVLLNMGVTKIEFFPSINKKNGNSIQIYFNYYNLSAILEFDEKCYDYCKYTPGCSAEELENCIVTSQYTNDFNIELFIKKFITTIEEDPRLVKSQNNNNIRNNKLYKKIAFISLLIPSLLVSILAIYTLVLDTSVQLNEWFSLFIIIPLIIWVIFDDKSNK